MNDPELDRILKSAPVPELPAEYWERFPKQVVVELRHRQANLAVPRDAESRRVRAGQGLWFAALGSRPALALGGVAAAGVWLGCFLGLRPGRPTGGGDAQFAEAQKCFREVAPLFPNQLEALVLDPNGARLVLAERPDMPQSPPLYIKVTGPKGAHCFVTFSGQQIRVNGDTFEVLVDRQGEVLLVGEQSVWSSSEPGAKAGPYRIEARPLPANS
jgi:hypothetical protein